MHSSCSRCHLPRLCVVLACRFLSEYTHRRSNTANLKQCCGSLGLVALFVLYESLARRRHAQLKPPVLEVPFSNIPSAAMCHACLLRLQRALHPLHPPTR